MMDKTLRQVKDNTVEPFVKRLGGGFHPTILTLVGTVFAILAAVSAFLGLYNVGLLFWLLNRLMDGLDGAYARIWNKKSDLGGYLDTLSDFLAYTIIPFGFVLHNPSIEGLIIVAFLFGTFYVNAAAFMYLAAILERSSTTNSQLTSLAMPRGIVEGGEAILFFCAFFLLPNFVLVLFTLLGCLVIATTVQHILWAIRNLD